MSDEFMAKLEAMRVEAGFPFIVNSAFRSPDYNRQIGGSPNSQHLYGNAVDLRLYGDRAIQVIVLARKWGMGGIGVQQKGPHASRFIHIDGRSLERAALWSY